MKKFLLILLGVILASMTTTALRAEEMDKGSANDSMMDMLAGEEEMAEPVEDMEAEQEMMMEETEEAAEEENKKEDWGVAPSAWAVMKGTDANPQITGRVDFVESGGGVQVVASFKNVTPAGNHGFHIHENGSCEDGGKAAGGHFNPAGTDHGFLPRDGHGKAHTGDMGNIEIDDNGNSTLVLYLAGLSLTEGHTNISGKAVILHAQEDDFGQPTGNAGGRIACGVITMK